MGKQEALCCFTSGINHCARPTRMPGSIENSTRKTVFMRCSEYLYTSLWDSNNTSFWKRPIFHRCHPCADTLEKAFSIFHVRTPLSSLRTVLLSSPGTVSTSELRYSLCLKNRKRWRKRSATRKRGRGTDWWMNRERQTTVVC